MTCTTRTRSTSGGGSGISEPAPEGQARPLDQSPSGAAAAGGGGEHSRCNPVLTGCGPGAYGVHLGYKSGSACWSVECRGGTVRLQKASRSVQCGCLMVRGHRGTGGGLSRCVELMQDSRKRTFVPHNRICWPFAPLLELMQDTQSRRFCATHGTSPRACERTAIGWGRAYVRQCG